MRRTSPKLALKAADGRHFLPILLKVLQLFFPAGSPRREGHGRMRRNPVRHLQGAQHLGHDGLVVLASRPWRADTSSCCASSTTGATTRTYGASTQSTTCSCTCASPHSRRGSIRSSSGATVMKVSSAWRSHLAKRSHASHIEKCLLERYRVSLD